MLIQCVFYIYVKGYNKNKEEVFKLFKIEKPEYVNKTFRIEKTLLERLEQIAQTEGVSVNSLVVQCCNYALDHLDNTKNQ